MPVKVTNNASATLATSINTTATTIVVTAGQGALFPSLAAGDSFFATLVDSSNNLEIVRITARSTDTMTAVRGQDGTTARSYNAGDRLELRPVAATLNTYLQSDSPFTQINIVPTGAVTMWATATLPNGWLACNGQAVSRSTYAALFTVLGTSYGAGDGSTTFNLPNFNDRMPIGAGSIAALAGTGGSKDATLVAHTHTYSGNTAGMNQNQAHSHSASDSGHYHDFNTNPGGGPILFTQGTVGYAPQAGFTGGAPAVQLQPFTQFASANISVSATNTDHLHAFSGTTASSGSSATNANLPPYLGINFIIKAV